MNDSRITSNGKGDEARGMRKRPWKTYLKVYAILVLGITTVVFLLICMMLFFMKPAQSLGNGVHMPAVQVLHER